MLDELDLVELARPVLHAGVHVGDVGTIVHVYTTPSIAYEVEFADTDGQTIASLVLGAEDVRAVTMASATH